MKGFKTMLLLGCPHCIYLMNFYVVGKFLHPNGGGQVGKTTHRWGMFHCHEACLINSSTIYKAVPHRLLSLFWFLYIFVVYLGFLLDITVPYSELYFFISNLYLGWSILYIRYFSSIYVRESLAFWGKEEILKHSLVVASRQRIRGEHHLSMN